MTFIQKYFFIRYCTKSELVAKYYKEKGKSPCHQGQSEKEKTDEQQIIWSKKYFDKICKVCFRIKEEGTYLILELKDIYE